MKPSRQQRVFSYHSLCVSYMHGKYDVVTFLILSLLVPSPVSIVKTAVFRTGANRVFEVVVVILVDPLPNVRPADRLGLL